MLNDSGTPERARLVTTGLNPSRQQKPKLAHCTSGGY